MRAINKNELDTMKLMCGRKPGVKSKELDAFMESGEKYAVLENFNSTAMSAYNTYYHTAKRKSLPIRIARRGENVIAIRTDI